MFDLTGKTALITGATGGIGRQIAKKMHAQGATLALTDMNMETLKAFKRFSIITYRLSVIILT